MAAAVKTITSEEKAHRQEKYYQFKQQIVNGLKSAGVAFEVNGSLDRNNLQHVLNLWIKGVSTYVMQTNLDLAGIAVSGGSACTAGSIEPSHVLTAMFGADSPRISESIRISFGRYTTEKDISALITNISKIVSRVKARSEVK